MSNITKIFCLQPFWLKPGRAFPPLPLKRRGFHGLKPDFCNAFQALQIAILEGEIQTVVVWKLDRLARHLREGVNVLADWCQRGVRVVSVMQHIDLSGPVGHLIVSLLFGIAEIE